MKNILFLALALILASSCASPLRQKEPFTFVQMCDTQLGMGGYEHDKKTFAQAVKQVNKLKPDFTVICGDLVNNANDKSFIDFKKIKSGFTARCYCAAGNHDVQNKPTVASLKYYREQIGKDYYSFIHKGYTFVVVNTQLWVSPVEHETQKQDKWLVGECEKAKAKSRPIFIIAHYPLFTKDPNEKDNYYNVPLKIRTRLLKLYVEHGVIAVLAGHTHRRIINNYKGIQLVNGETTSKSRPALGFRLWDVNSPSSVKHTFVPLEARFNRDGTKKPFTVLSLGDSITAGGKAFTCYRQVLIPELRKRKASFKFIGPNKDATSAHAGYGGKNTLFLHNISKEIYSKYPADIVMIHSGHNSFSKDKPVAGIIKDTEAIIKNIHGINSDVKFLLAQVISSGKLPKYSYIPELNKELKILVNRLKKEGIKITLVNLAENFDWKTDTISDKVHPNSLGAKKMSDKWMEVLLPILK